MRTCVLLALALAVPVSAAAQAQTPSSVPAGRHTFLPRHKQTLSIDFGARKAAKNLPQLPVRCDTVRKHRPAGFIELPVYGRRQHTTPVTLCPVR